MFEFHNGIVTMSPEAEGIPEFAALKRRKSFEKIIAYLFFVYGKKSPYANLFEYDRKLIVSTDRLGDPQEYKRIEEQNRYIISLRFFVLNKGLIPWTP